MFLKFRSEQATYRKKMKNFLIISKNAEKICRIFVQHIYTLNKFNLKLTQQIIKQNFQQCFVELNQINDDKFRRMQKICLVEKQHKLLVVVIQLITNKSTRSAYITATLCLAASYFEIIDLFQRFLQFQLIILLLLVCLYARCVFCCLVVSR